MIKYRRLIQQNIRRRSFLLIEVLVSLTLIALCFFPLIKPLVAMRRADWSHLEKIQLQQISQLAFCRVKEKLYNQAYSWKELTEAKDTDTDRIKGVLEEPFSIVTGQKTTRSVRCNYTIGRYKKDATKKTPPSVGRILQVTLRFDVPFEHSFVRTLYLEQKSA
jgi:hypothetical protein